MQLIDEKKLLLHICCGVCASRIIERLLLDYDVIGYFYNPNIEPEDEYQKRLKATEILFKHFGIKLITGIYENQQWHREIAGLEHLPEGGHRCWRCFRFRLQATAEQAVKGSIGLFATTLTASPYKNAKVINKFGHKIGLLNNINFVEINSEPTDKSHSSLAKKLGLYHQKYCGCNYSVTNDCLTS